MSAFDSEWSRRVERVEASVGLPVGLWRTGITGKEWERKVHEAASERRIQAVTSQPMRTR